MLTDLPEDILAALNDLPSEGLLAILDAIGGGANKPRLTRLDTGVYQIHSFSLDNMLMPASKGGLVTNTYPFSAGHDAREKFPDDVDARLKYMREQIEAQDGSLPDPYGVCDSPAQLLEKFPALATVEGQHVVSMTHVAKDPSNAGNGGGWRWHKWGAYIGDGEPMCEYLDDEELFSDGVWIFHILEVEIPKEWY